MNKTAFDDHIKKQFSHYEPEVPSYIWDKIIAERDRKKPAAFWMTWLNKKNGFIIALILVLGTGLIYYLDSNDNNLPVVDNKIVNTKIPNDEQGNNRNITKQSSDQASGQIVANTDDVTAPSVSKLSIANGSIQKEPALSLPQEDISNEESSLSEVPENKLNNKPNFILPRYLLNIDRQETKKKFSFDLILPKMIGLPVPCPSLESNAAANKKYIELYAGPDFAFRSFSDTGNSAYLSKRKESTRFSYAYSAGIRYTRVFNNSMSIRTGINYSQINEKFTYKEGNIVHVIYIINNNGDTTGSYSVTGTNYKSSNNRFHTADIPLIIGYELGNGRLHANLNAGAIINVYSWQKGEVLDTANKPINISTGSTASPYHFKKNMGVGFMGAVSVYYKINDRMHILAEPYYRYNFSSASKPDLTLKQKYNTAGIRLGIRLDLP